MKSSKMTRLLALLLCAIMAISLFACDNGDDETTGGAGEATTEAPTTTHEETTGEKEPDPTVETTGEKETDPTVETTDEKETDPTVETTGEKETTPTEDTTKPDNNTIVLGDYANGGNLKEAGDNLKKTDFALKENVVDESKAVEKTAAQMLELLANKDGVKAGEVYKVTDKLTLASDTTYYGNLAAIIAEGGIELSSASGIVLRELIVIGNITIKNSTDVELYKLDIRASDTGISIDAFCSDIAVKASIINASGVAITSEANSLSVYQTRIVADKGVISSGNDFTIQECQIEAKSLGVAAYGKYSIVRNNTITAENGGVGVDMSRGGYNGLVALNFIKDVQKSVIINGGYNCVVVLNRAIYIGAENNTHLYIIKNRLGGAMELKNNKYFICDENVFLKDKKDHPIVSIGNTETNGDNITDINARSEYGVNEDLLPHGDQEHFLGMERRDNVTDISSSKAQDYASYVRNNARTDSVVVVPPGAYTAEATISIDASCSDTDIYSYGVYVEGNDYYRLTFFSSAENIDFRGLTWGYSVPASGQLHIVEKLGDNKVLAVNAAGYAHGFGLTDKTKFWSNGVTWHQDENTFYGDTNSYSIADNGDGTFTLTLRTAGDYEKAEVGDIWTCRLQVDRIETVRLANAKNISFKDVSLHGYGNATAWRNQGVEDVSYERAHAFPNYSVEITKEIYDKYKALEEKYGVDLEVHTRELNGETRYFGCNPRTGSTGTMEVADATGGVSLTSCTLECMFDDGSNQRGTVSRIAGYVKNNDGTYTIYYKGCISQVYHTGENCPVAGTKWNPGNTASVAKGDKLFVYASNGAVMFDGAEALDNPVVAANVDYHFAHTDSDSNKYCDVCKTKVFQSATKYYNAYNSVYNKTTGKITFEIDRNGSYQSQFGSVKYETTVYAVKISAEGVNEDALKGYDLADNGCDPKGQVFFVNSTKNCPEFTFDNVYMKSGIARGVLIKTNDVTIKNCTFEDIGHQGLKIGQETNWGEGTVPRRVKILNCIFDNNNILFQGAYRAGYSTISIQGLGGAGGIYENVELQETFACSDITIDHNKFVNTYTQYIIDATGARDIKITNNIFEEREGDGKIMYINSCLDVTFEGNTYSETLKPFVEKNLVGRFMAAANFKRLQFEGYAVPDMVAN